MNHQIYSFRSFQVPSGRSVITEATRGGKKKVLKDDDFDEPEVGWWQNPEEASLSAYNPLDTKLESWQTDLLERAAALGRRRVSVVDLAQEMQIDRNYVLYLLKEFEKKPQHEKAEIIAHRLSELKAEPDMPVWASTKKKQKGDKKAAEEAKAMKASAPSQPSTSLHTNFEPMDEKAGFTTWKTRREQQELNRNMPSMTLRTLEAVYESTPFPSDSVVKSMWDLHRLNRENTLSWFKQRRDIDGILTSTQARRKKQNDNFLDDFVFLSDSQDGSDMFDPDVDDEFSLLGEALQKKASGGAGGEGEPAAVREVKLSAREMVRLKSSLPSRRKFKGHKNAARGEGEAGAVPGQEVDESVVRIGDMKFVQDDDDKSWEKSWRPVKLKRSSWGEQ